MERIRYRRSSLRTQLGVTQEEKKIKRELGITALLRPFRWWGNEKRHIKRELGYYSPDVQLARHVLPHWGSKLLMLALILMGIPFALGWWLKTTLSNPPQPGAAAPGQSAPAESVPATAQGESDRLR
jgi:hypothetical protein